MLDHSGTEHYATLLCDRTSLGAAVPSFTVRFFMDEQVTAASRPGGAHRREGRGTSQGGKLGAAGPSQVPAASATVY